MEIINTYIINLASRLERKDHILSQFEGREEFQFELFPAIVSQNGAEGLWNSIKSIVINAKRDGLDYVLVCEDDHMFTDVYQSESLFSYLQVASNHQCEILIGGPSSCRGYIFPINNDLLHVDFFTGTQFIIIFKRLYDRILDFVFDKSSLDGADLILSRIANSKIVIHPFISVQKEFGYSDITPFYNSNMGYVEQLYVKCDIHLNLMRNIYHDLNFRIASDDEIELPKNWVVPTYVICDNNNQSLDRVYNQFSGKDELNIVKIDVVSNSKTKSEIFKSIISNALDTDEEVILIVNGEHEFTKSYTLENLARDLYIGLVYGVELISGVCYFATNITPANRNLFWANSLLNDQFLLVFKPFYKKVLSTTFSDDNFFEELSRLAISSFVQNPFMSSSIIKNDAEKSFEVCRRLLNQHY
ncbi:MULTISPECIES: glycosyltransferase family 25 protein [Sphingobacterium]|uniref:Uncharacterized protein n=1 Tax=Sphingobacterium populi TaxID=1812824 RepID=A0ABW5U9G2_9SPHI|nr:hypothetical protein [Sphingobacterium sp. CFCC 11742]